jgi:type VI secretion system protein ImpK
MKSAATDPSTLVDDPFAQRDEPRTFTKPNPLGRAPRGADGAAREPTVAADLGVPEHGMNGLVALANPLLLVVPQLRATRQVDDPVALRNALAQGIREFAARAAAAGIAAERVMAARYVLCTMLDEAAAHTPWGGSGVWGGHSLLTMFHNETWGGEKVFQLMARLAEKPAEHRELLELIYAALVLGFEGRYRVVDNGQAQLEAVRDRLARILKEQRGDYPSALAEHWQGRPGPARLTRSWLPLAAGAACVALLLAGVYVALSFSLGARSDPVFGRIQGLHLPPPVPAATSAPAPAPAPAPAAPRLAQFLRPDIDAGLVAVRDEADRSVVTMRGDGLFAPGMASLVPERQALMERVADALARLDGAVLVTGHTDSQAIRSVRFPSNWHLSQERARSVRDLLVARQVAPQRVRAEGRADGQPLVPNDTPGNRALNRRVEITLFAAGAPAAAASAPGGR